MCVLQIRARWGKDHVRRFLDERLPVDQEGKVRESAPTEFLALCWLALCSCMFPFDLARVKTLSAVGAEFEAGFMSG